MPNPHYAEAFSEVPDAAALKAAMRHVAGAVAVVTAGEGEDRTGLTATSAVSLSTEPPTMLICVNRTASAWPVIQAQRHFCINVLAAHQRAVAERFAGRDGIKGAARYAEARWSRLVTGALALDEALVAIDCALEEAIERHSHAIVIGAVRAVRIRTAPGAAALLYAEGRFRALDLA